MQGYVRTGNSQPAWLFPFIVTTVLILSVLPLARLAMVGISRRRGTGECEEEKNAHRHAGGWVAHGSAPAVDHACTSGPGLLIYVVVMASADQ